MKLIRWLLILLLVFLSACAPKSGGGGSGIFGVFPSPTPLPTARVSVTHAPDARIAITNFLEALKTNDFASMYALLASDSKAALTQDAFAKQYNDALDAMGVEKLDYEVHTETLHPDTALVGYGITYHTALFGDIQREFSANLKNENGEWRVEWNNNLILPEMANGDVLKTDYQIPARGDIYDQNGKPIVAQSDAYALGVVPGQIGAKSEAVLDTELSKVCGMPPDEIKALYANAAPDWYVGICEVSADQAKAALNLGIGGLQATPYNSRFYFDSGIAPQVVGYTQLIQPQQLDQYRRMGYRGTESVGQSGIEKSMESYLAGKHGGTLYVVDPNGQIVKQIAAANPQAADSVYLTIDENMQYWAQQALTGYNGAIVVLERNTGRVLAMASSPEFDPNAFDANNFNNSYLINNLLNDTNQPLVNRAAQGQYPLGSVFKIIAMAAALESGLYEPKTTYDCQYHFTELNGITLNDWTWEFCQNALKAGKQCNDPSTTPSGLITLQQGLMRSCDPYFWHISVDLFNNNRAGDITNMAHAFGIGSPTGIDDIAEATGSISVPTTLLQATNQVIGQGDVTVTPLQVARFVAAVGNGGTLYQPQLVEKVQPADGSPIQTFKPNAQGTLPVRSDNLAAIQEAMNWVMTNPLGTGYYAMLGLNIPMGGKTGTAQTGPGLEPDAWFAGYTNDAQNSGKPDIAIAVIMENAGEGADYAAPIFRAMVETYYYGSPQAQPWFGPIGNPYTPTPIGGIPTRTPRPKGGNNQPTPVP
ncbi:MAG: penicillin-binding transpeptidase domain-containing protein [Chloroflexi bacterium]|nr:penicillin-binding transpeptidase domain-containing protein [Chloroflexota bacterium]